MDHRQTSFLIFAFITTALIIYGMGCGRWLAEKSYKLTEEVKGDRQRGLKALAMWPISFIAIIILPVYIESLNSHFGAASDKRNILPWMTLILIWVYNIYYRFRLIREHGKKS